MNGNVAHLENTIFQYFRTSWRKLERRKIRIFGALSTKDLHAKVAMTESQSYAKVSKEKQFSEKIEAYRKLIIYKEKEENLGKLNFKTEKMKIKVNFPK